MKVWIKIDRPIDVGVDLPFRDEASEKIRLLYGDIHRNDFVFWLDDDGTMGCIKNNRSISMVRDNVAVLELQERKPAKGRGYVALSFLSNNGEQICSISSVECSKKALDWLKSVQDIISNEVGLKSRYSDHGYDA